MVEQGSQNTDTTARITQILNDLRVRQVDVVVASHKTATVEAVGQVLGVDPARVFGQDPERASRDLHTRVEEPLSPDPKAAVVFKVYRLIVFLEQLRRLELLQSRSRRVVRRVLTSARPEAASTETRLLLPIIQEFMRLTQMYREAEVKSFVEQHMIFASDVVLHIEDEPVHRWARTNEILEPESVESIKEFHLELLRQRHVQPTNVAWHCAFGSWDRGQTRLTEFVIETTIPSLAETDLIEKYYDPSISGGLQLVELLEHFPDQPFYLRQKNSSSKVEISRQQALWMIVKKSLPMEAMIEFLTNPAQSEQVEGAIVERPEEKVEIGMVAIALTALAEKE